MVHVSELDSRVTGEIEAFVTDWLSDARVPGASIAVVDGGEVVYAAGFGARNLESNEPATPDTVYGVASVTKSFTALAVLQLVESGDVALAAPVSEYVPFFEHLDDPPSVEELLTHTSGMPSDAASVALILRGIDAAPVEVPLSSEADFNRYVDQSTAFRTTDEERFFYYNSGYEVLGRLVEAVDGRSFAAYVDDEILAPIGMRRSSLDPSILDERTDVMTPYMKEDGKSVETPYPDKGIGAAGGLLSPVSDLAEYLRFLLDPDPGVVDPTLLQAARESHVTRQTYLDGTDQQYGYGWMRRPLLDDELVEHGGTLGISASYVGYLEDAELGIAIGANTTPEIHPMTVGPALLAMLQGEDPVDVVPYYGIDAKLERVTGEYESYRGIVEAVVDRAEGGGVEVTFTLPEEEQSFVAHPRTADPDDLTFEFVTDGGVRTPLTFEDAGEGWDMFYQRWRLEPT